MDWLRRSDVAANSYRHPQTLQGTLSCHTPAAVRQVVKQSASRAAEEGLVALFGEELDMAIAALSTHSLRVGLTQVSVGV